LSDAPITTDVIRRLRLAYASGTPRATSDACEDPEQIWEAVQGSLEPARVGQLLDHANACTACDRAFQLARELHRQLPEAAERKVVPIHASPRWIRRRALAGALLASAAAAIAVVALRRENPPAERVLREGASQSIVALPVADRLPRDQFLLRWSGGPKGTIYELWVTTPDLREIYRAARLETPEARVPASALEGLPRGGEVLWRVEARFPDGGHGESPAFRARVQ
jgi:hypothetical protein